MIKPEIIQRIKDLELYTKKMARSLLQGDNRSSLKGSGFDFDQIREYQEGDDVRAIDWKSTARNSKLLVKQYKEEKTRTIILAVDISDSTDYGSQKFSKQEAIGTIAGILGLAGSYKHDAVGLVLFSDQVEAYVPPARGKQHMHTLLNVLFSARTANKKTCIAAALQYIARLTIKDGLIFLLSDFIDTNFQKQLAVVAHKHEVIAISCTDGHEKQLPTVGFLTLRDTETGNQILVDLRSGSSELLNDFLARRVHQQKIFFARAGVDMISLEPDQNYVHELINFFSRRKLR